MPRCPGALLLVAEAGVSYFWRLEIGAQLAKTDYSGIVIMKMSMSMGMIILLRSLITSRSSLSALLTLLFRLNGLSQAESSPHIIGLFERLG